MKANVGMLYPVYAPIATYTPGTGITYGNGAVIAEAISANITWNRNSEKFFGDDVEIDSDNGVTGYTISFEPSGLKDAVRAALLGETLANSDYEINSDAAPDVGYGYIRVMRETGENGVVTTTYESWWYRMLKFGISNEETRTKEGGGLQWRVPTLEGIGAGVNLDNSGKLKFAMHRTHATASAAMAWLKALANIT